MENVQLTGLALEYQRDYGAPAGRNLNLSDLFDDSATQGKVRIFGLRFQEQTTNSRFVDTCMLFDNGANPLLVGLDRAEGWEITDG